MEQNIEFNQENGLYNSPAQLQDHTTMIVPGPLIISDSAIATWNTTMQTAQDRIRNHRSASQLEPIHTTDKDKCWLTLMVLRREQELDEIMKYAENAWQELNEVKRLLGVRRNQ
ncbi:uncharacterized protein F5147DRAFT_779550 [Suillus discolor]|uniref:Uncharacterized protein n=1 Tax=Suillus discolor TaxID=1912936 RepID=A0A9P7EW93_9AGAM|nr:uncharacterized protein F5147DRAFT_779550 [Suillus discolor]KAG2092806.1 hypothetical protein F5147DRAFT_779550 [Suillus discolor]